VLVFEFGNLTLEFVDLVVAVIKAGLEVAADKDDNNEQDEQDNSNRDHEAIGKDPEIKGTASS
jgi:hypothetical protein